MMRQKLLIRNLAIFVYMMNLALSQEVEQSPSSFSTSSRTKDSNRVQRFRLINKPPLKGHKPLANGVSRTKDRGGSADVKKGDVAADLGATSALRSGRVGSFTYNSSFSELAPVNKKTEGPVVEAATKTDHKINIETKLSSLATPPQKKEVVTAGHTAILHCYFSEEDLAKNTVIWWTKQPQKSGDRPIIIAAGTQVRHQYERIKVLSSENDPFSVLVIRNVGQDDAGEYKCSLPTVTGTKTEFTTLDVKESKRIEILTSAKDNLVKEGESLSLFCWPQGHQTSVWWTARDSSGNLMDINGHQGVGVGPEVVLKSFNKLMAGTYTCHVEGHNGEIFTRHFNVTSKEKPAPISAFYNGFNIDTYLGQFSKNPVYGETVQLRCDTEGLPVPTIEWFRGDQKILTNYKYIIKEFEPSYRKNAVISSLNIKSLEDIDEGAYICMAFNDSGEKRREFLVKGKEAVEEDSVESLQID